MTRKITTLAQMRARRDFHQHIAHGFANLQIARNLRDAGKNAAADFHAMCAGIERRHAAKAAALAVSLALAACGGGGGGGAGGPVAPFSAAPPTETAAPAENAPEAAPVEAPKPAPVCSVLYYGDSISALTAPRMDNRLAVELHGVYGGTAQANQAALLQDPLADRFVVVEFGKNDGNAGSPYEPAMRAMLDRIKAVGRTAVVVGLSHSTSDTIAHAAYNVKAGQLANEYGALWVDWGAVQYAGASDLMADGLHPNDAYQQRLADRLSAVILDAAPECRE